jgi:hypothetical protein
MQGGGWEEVENRELGKMLDRKTKVKGMTQIGDT